MVERICLKTWLIVLSFILLAVAGCLPPSKTQPSAPTADTVDEKPAAMEEMAVPPVEAKKIPPRYIEHRVMPGEDPGKIVDIYYGTSFSVVRFEYLGRTGRAVDLVLEFNNKKAGELVAGEIFRLPELDALPFRKDSISEYARNLFKMEDYKGAAEICRGMNKFESSVSGNRFVKNCERAGESFESGLAFFEKKDYRNASAEFAKTRKLNPDGKKAAELFHKSQFLLAVDLFKKGDPDAKNMMKAYSEQKNDCEKCREFEDAFKKSHYIKGFERFENGDPEEAIKEWDIVRFVDPDYTEIKQLEKKPAQTAKTNPTELEQYKALLEKAVVLFESQDFSGAIKELEASREYGHGCPACNAYEQKYKNDLFESGNRAFRMQRMDEAVVKWRLLQFVDPKFRELEVIDKIRIAEELLPQS